MFLNFSRVRWREMEVKGRHLLVDLWLDQELNDELMKKFTNVIDEDLTVVQKNQFHFEPYGLTVAYILAESHFTVHTYPEHKYLSMDIYICNDAINLDLILEKMLSGVMVKRINRKILDRGIY